MNCIGDFAMNYYEIGQRIRKHRKAQGLSQEQLAELVSISTTHMSHIETGNTKLSLPVLAQLSTVLGVNVDELLFDRPASQRQKAYGDIDATLNHCTSSQARIIAELVKCAKRAMDEYG